MDIFQAIKQRRTTHVFSKKKVSQEVIERSIVAANHAPCHRRNFPWRFISLGRKKRELLCKVQISLKFGDKPIDEFNCNKIKGKILNPSHLLVASQVCTDNKVQKLDPAGIAALNPMRQRHP